MRVISLEISTITKTKRIILIVLIKVRLIILVVHISLIISAYSSKAYSSYSFEFLSIEISIFIIYKLIRVIITSTKRIELFKVTNNNKRNSKVIRIVR
jgi:hypothetical protein